MALHLTLWTFKAKLTRPGCSFMFTAQTRERRPSNSAKKKKVELFLWNRWRLEFEHYPEALSPALSGYFSFSSSNLFPGRRSASTSGGEVDPDRFLGPVRSSVSSHALCHYLSLTYKRSCSSTQKGPVPFSSNIGSNPPSRCCLSAESTRGIKNLGFFRADWRYLLELHRADSDLWPLM